MRGRLYALDSLRGIAALGVVCWHYAGYFWVRPLHHVLQPFYLNGLSMVDFFFVLSGFVLMRAYGQADRGATFAANMQDRIARLYPLHIFTMAVVIAIQLCTPADFSMLFHPFAHNTERNFFLNVFMLQASGLQEGPGESFNHPSWSISTEFLINLLFFAILWMTRRRVPIVLALLATVATILVWHNGLFNTLFAYGVVPGQIARTGAGFFVGTLTYRLYARWLEESTPRYGWLLDVSLLLIALSFMAYLCVHKLTGNAFDVVATLIAYPSMIVLVLRRSEIRRVLECRPLVFIGERSYSIYLVHFSVLLAIYILRAPFHVLPPLQKPVYLLGTLAIIIGLSALTYRYVELPGKRLLGTRRKDSPARLTEA